MRLLNTLWFLPKYCLKILILRLPDGECRDMGSKVAVVTVLKR